MPWSDGSTGQLGPRNPPTKSPAFDDNEPTCRHAHQSVLPTPTRVREGLF